MKSGSQLEAAFNLVKQFPHKTARELALLGVGTVTYDSLHKRLPELANQGIALKSADMRPCTVTGKPARMWEINPNAEVTIEASEG